MAIAVRNITSIVDVGEMPFDVAEPILKYIENPLQLHQVETNCPQLGAEEGDKMGAIWRRLLNKKFPKWEDQGYKVPKGLRGVDLYYFVKEEWDRDNADAEAILRQKLAGFDKERESKQTHIVNSKFLPKVPGGRKRASGPLFASGSKPKSMAGLNIIQRARREAANISKATALTTAKGNLAVAPGQLRKAPEAMVNDYRVAANPTVKIKAPTRRVGARPDLATKESRLLAIKGKASARPSGARPGVDAESEEKSWRVSRKRGPLPDDEEDDLFDEAPSKRARYEENLPVSRSAASPSKPGISNAGGLLTNKRGSGLLSNTYRPKAPSPAGERLVRKTNEAVSQPSPSGHTPQRNASASPYRAKPMVQAGPLSERGLERSRNGKGIVVPRSRSATPRSSQASHSPALSSDGSRPVTPVTESPSAAKTSSLSGRPSPATVRGSMTLNPPDVSLMDGGPAQPRLMRKKKVDIFMRPKKSAH